MRRRGKTPAETRQHDRMVRKVRARLGMTMLDCYFCGKNFDGFTDLAAHVKRDHADERLERDSALRSAETTTLERNGESSMAAKTTGEKDRREFLRPADLNRRGTTDIKFEKSIRTFTGKYGAQLVIAVTVNRKPFDFGVKLNGQNHIALEKKLGRNIIEWAGKTIGATVKTFDSDDGEREYIELVGAARRERD